MTMTEPNSSKTDFQNAAETDQPAFDRIGFDSLLEDLFGLNVKGLKTIWTLLISPAKYFQAAKSREWMNKYTPSFRVWFGIVALTAAFKFIYAGKDSAMLELYTLQMEAMKETFESGRQSAGRDPIDLSHIDPEVSAMSVLKWIFILSPFMTMIFMSLLAFVYRAWGEKLSFVVRLRYVFAMIITGSVVGFFGSFLTLFASGPLFMTINNILIVVIGLLYFSTAYFGPYAHYERGERFAFSLVLSTLCFAAMMTAILLSTVLATIPVGIAMVS